MKIAIIIMDADGRPVVVGTLLHANVVDLDGNLYTDDVISSIHLQLNRMTTDDVVLSVKASIEE